MVEEPAFWVLGVNPGRHDSAAALTRDGRLVVMVEQERLSRNKRAVGEAPVLAIEYCLRHAGIGPDDLSAVAIGSDLRRLDEWHGLTREEVDRQERLDDPERLLPRDRFRNRRLPPFIPVRHHLAHAASAYWPSGFEDAAVLVIDNRGEDTSTTLAHACNGEIRILEEYGVGVSLGLYYRTAAQYAGLYRRFGEVGKLMGLAAYGRPTQRVPLAFTSAGPAYVGLGDPPPLRGVDLPPHRTRQLLDYFSAHSFPYAVGTGEEVMAYADFAASVQHALEETVLGCCDRLRALTASPNLVLAGGVALNCSANGVVARSGLFSNLYIQPAAHDAGVALGAALVVGRQLAPHRFRPESMTHAYFGPGYCEDAIRLTLRQHGLTYAELSDADLCRAVAQDLAAGKVVGWHQGRAEVGPRSLGGRSLLGDPSRRATLVRLNRIKKREMWRPIAPSVPEERFRDYFDGPHASPFMVVACPVREDRRRDIPAVVHVDGSARPQAVSRGTNPRFWHLLQTFGDLTGTPVLANTSFNQDGEPIVNSPEDSVCTFLAAEIDALAIGSFYVRRTAAASGG